MSRLDDRQRLFWDLFDFSRGRGLEVGPLDRPIVARSSADVAYADVFDRAGLVAHYTGHAGHDVENIPEIDYPLTQDGVTRTLAEAADGGAPFDWVVASHVIEHIPDVIGWLDDLAEVVVDGGTVVLAVPDKRFCFDAVRPETTVGQMLAAHHRGDRVPSPRAVYDYFSWAVAADTARIWQGDSPTSQQRIHGPEHALTMADKAAGGEYVDCHIWLWTPHSFLDQMHELRRIGRAAWYVDHVEPTAPDQLEFLVTLRRVPRGADPTAPLDDEVLPVALRPEWLEREALEHRVRYVSANLARRETQLRESRNRLRRQRKRSDRLARQLRQLQSSRASRLIDRLRRRA